MNVADILAEHGYTSWDDYLDDHVATQLAWRDEDAQRGIAAMRLSPSLNVYQALLRGEQVPVAALDPHWRERYRL